VRERQELQSDLVCTVQTASIAEAVITLLVQVAREPAVGTAVQRWLHRYQKFTAMQLLTAVEQAIENKEGQPSCSPAYACAYSPDGPAPAPGNPSNLYESFRCVTELYNDIGSARVN
jgi:hypothetical protein